MWQNRNCNVLKREESSSKPHLKKPPIIFKESKPRAEVLFKKKNRTTLVQTPNTWQLDSPYKRITIYSWIKHSTSHLQIEDTLFHHHHHHHHHSAVWSRTRMTWVSIYLHTIFTSYSIQIYITQHSKWQPATHPTSWCMIDSWWHLDSSIS
jgi:hypothetical protein